MASERATKVFDYYKDLQQRAEYLLVGLLAASIAFFWQNGKPERLGVNPATLHLFGLMFLFLGLLCAMIRLNRQPLIYAVNTDVLDLQDERGDLVKSASQGKMVASPSHGVMDPEQQVARIEAIDQRLKRLKEKMREINLLCSRLYHLRNLCMAIGYLIFLGHRMWLPYS